MSALSSAAPSAAQSPERARARALFAQGEKALKAGDVGGAEQDFEKAYQTLPNAAVLLKIAECKEQQEDFQGAVTTLEKYLSDRPKAADRADVEARIEEMRKKPGTVTVKSSPSGAAIWVDGKDTALVTPSDVSLEPGEHHVALKLSPYRTAEQDLVVEFASKSTLDLTLKAPAPEPPPAVKLPAPVPYEPPPPSGRGLTVPFWISVGVTAAGAAVTTTFGIVALDKHSQFERTPTKQIADDGERAALISDVALGVALAGAVTATVLFFTTGRGEERPEQSFFVSPLVGARTGGLVGNARF